MLQILIKASISCLGRRMEHKKVVMYQEDWNKMEVIVYEEECNKMEAILYEEE